MYSFHILCVRLIQTYNNSHKIQSNNMYQIE